MVIILNIVYTKENFLFFKKVTVNILFIKIKEFK